MLFAQPISTCLALKGFIIKVIHISKCLIIFLCFNVSERVWYYGVNEVFMSATWCSFPLCKLLQIQGVISISTADVTSVHHPFLHDLDLMTK